MVAIIALRDNFPEALAKDSFLREAYKFELLKVSSQLSIMGVILWNYTRKGIRMTLVYTESAA